MKKRNFSMQEYWMNRIKDWEPVYSFKGETREDWADWRKSAYPKLIELLGEFPKKVDLEPEVQYSVEDKGIIRELVIFNSEEFMSVPCYVLYPANMKADGSNPAIVCSHGHGPCGKDSVAGVRSTPEHEEDIRAHNHNYAEQMARAGFFTIVPGVRVYGEKSDGPDPFPGRDACNVNFIKGAILGIYMLTLNIWDSIRCIDYLETRPEVDKARIGMMGLSGGGTMTAFTGAVDERIKAADIMGYINPLARFGIERANFCGSQIVPELYRYFDTDEIAGLIAPRPLLLEMGIYDECFYIQDQIKGYEGVKDIYKAAGVEDRLWVDIFPGPHSFGGNKAFEFFRKYL
jgi:dienelactone hydrolase